MKRRKKWSGMIAAAAVPVFIVGAFAAGSNSVMMKKPASSMMMMKNQNRYGGMIYAGKPMLNITASLLKAGGGGPNFSIAKALTSMVGSKAVNAEVAKLKKQYGAMRVARFIQLTDYGVKDAYYKSVRAGVKLPKANLSGKKLAITLVQLGVNSNGVFYEGTQLDKLISHKTHMAVMNDFDNKKGFGEEADKDYHRITNQAMYDLAHALGMKNVKLAPLH
jgi:hypothetical protein